MIPHYKTNVTDEFQLVNLLLVRDGQYFVQHLHCTSNGYGLITSQLKVTFWNQDAIENQVDCPFLIGIGGTISCIPKDMGPVLINAVHIDIEIDVGIQRQKLTKI
ncbi:unnamed protein product [Rotaria sordida]|uniref:Uncharacterized protein n=2 Tax=Rotaria sordida TaxID=392033 RepID=A0A813YUC8_9BILA|nr:unnamed protein product [Rotaria sordida]CAF0889141.1 unnamed protein product [Rotaria sordida]CAF0935487.1 unnamed protein product [Rotaria sordida]CAF3877668.1 unnamed protein product [Rotaria sordida]CAF3977299.1 unnamed protein product [Rotaria sordida]